MSTQKTIIEQYAVSEATSSNGWNALTTMVAENHIHERTSFELQLESGEIEFMEQHYGDDPDAKFTGGVKKGTWKFRSYLPKAYTSAKGTLAKAMEVGVDMLDGNGMPLGKSALQKAINSVPVPSITTDAWDVAVKELVKVFNDTIPALPERKQQTLIEWTRDKLKADYSRF